MKAHALTLILAATLAGVPVFSAGCDRTVSENKDVKVNADGTKKVDATVVKQSPDGTVTKTEEHKVDHPTNP